MYQLLQKLTTGQQLSKNMNNKEYPAFVIRNNTGGGWMYAGRTVKEALNCLSGELQTLLDEEYYEDILSIEIQMMSDEYVKNMPEFEGW